MAELEIIAEVGSVHDGSLGNALKLIELAAECGATTVKFQTHIAEAETLREAPSPTYFSAEPRYQYFVRTGFDTEQWKRIARQAEECGVKFLSSPFSLEAVALLEDVGVGAYKIPSGEVSNLPLLECVAATRKPVLVSSGMSDWAELDKAVATLRSGGDLTVMQCSSAYPCPPEHVGLNVLVEMRERYGVRIGFSDHTLGIAAPIAAVTLGAEVVEKHLTFSRKMYGSDAPHSLEPSDFTLMVKSLKEVAKMTASPVDKNDLSRYRDMKRIFEKSIVTAMPIPAGTRLSHSMLAFKKPGDGMPAADYMQVVNRVIGKDLPQNHKLSETDFLE